MTALAQPIRVDIADSYGNRLISGAKYKKIDYTSTVNAPADAAGDMTLDLVGTVDIRKLQNGNRIGVFDVTKDTASGLSRDRLDMNTIWLVDFARHYTTSAGNEYTEVKAKPARSLISTRDVLYTEGMTQERTRNGKADDLLKNYVTTNFVTITSPFPAAGGGYTPPSFDTGPNRALGNFFSVQGLTGSAPVVPYVTGSWRDLGKLFAEICLASETAGVNLYWDIVSTDLTKMQFQTFIGQRGVDRTQNGTAKQATFLEKRGNLVEPSHEIDWRNSWNYVVAGGKGEGRLKQLAVAYDTNLINASAFGRREKYIAATKYNTQADLLNEAKAELRKGRPKDIFTAKAISIPSFPYGTAWGLGDRVLCQCKSGSFTCLIDTVTVSINEKGVRSAWAGLRNIV